MNFVILITAQYFFLVSIIGFLLYAAYLWLHQRWKFFPILILSALSFPLSFIIAKIFAHFIYDPRPFVVEHIKPLFAHAADNGFPSDHMLLTMTIASVVFAYNKKLGILLTFIAICIGAARVLANVHHIEDIVGSATIAVVASGLAFFVERRYFRKSHIINKFHIIPPYSCLVKTSFWFKGNEPPFM